MTEQWRPVYPDTYLGDWTMLSHSTMTKTETAVRTGYNVVNPEEWATLDFMAGPYSVSLVLPPEYRICRRTVAETK